MDNHHLIKALQDSVSSIATNLQISSIPDSIWHAASQYPEILQPILKSDGSPIVARFLNFNPDAVQNPEIISKLLFMLEDNEAVDTLLSKVNNIKDVLFFDKNALSNWLSEKPGFFYSKFFDNERNNHELYTLLYNHPQFRVKWFELSQSASYEKICEWVNNEPENFLDLPEHYAHNKELALLAMRSININNLILRRIFRKIDNTIKHDNDIALAMANNGLFRLLNDDNKSQPHLIKIAFTNQFASRHQTLNLIACIPENAYVNHDVMQYAFMRLEHAHKSNDIYGSPDAYNSWYQIFRKMKNHNDYLFQCFHDGNKWHLGDKPDNLNYSAYRNYFDSVLPQIIDNYKKYCDYLNLHAELPQIETKKRTIKI